MFTAAGQDIIFNSWKKGIKGILTNKSYFVFMFMRHILVLDERDRILDARFKKEINNIMSQLPKQRQTLLFSATQTMSVKDLARLSLKDPEYISMQKLRQPHLNV